MHYYIANLPARPQSLSLRDCCGYSPAFDRELQVYNDYAALRLDTCFIYSRVSNLDLYYDKG